MAAGLCLPQNILRTPPRAVEWGAEEARFCLGIRCPPGASGLAQSPCRGCECYRAGTSGRPRPCGTPGMETQDQGAATTEAARPQVRHGPERGEGARGCRPPPKREERSERCSA
ncbi:hypothetical protein NDU88_003966 [Pleurodeles waltl]|uniref:Uncharacterized protein n=1 Tax=Pleurodeles waltl TaxID=8319 RepID=A0AAV7UHX8_PLEWA|nr:hypothetical protein NDU88_003966 [Pleurodeles waltl]